MERLRTTSSFVDQPDKTDRTKGVPSIIFMNAIRRRKKLRIAATDSENASESVGPHDSPMISRNLIACTNKLLAVCSVGLACLDRVASRINYDPLTKPWPRSIIPGSTGQVRPPTVRFGSYHEARPVGLAKHCGVDPSSFRYCAV